MKHMIDLHTHTTASDGIDSPVELVHKARELGIAILGISDHDTTNGLAQAAATAAALGDIEIIPAIELSTKENGRTVHVLGYFIDPLSPALQEQFTALVDQRRVRIARIASRLRLAGIDLSPVVVRRIMAENVPGRPHIAHAMVNAGYVDTVTQAFEAYLVQGKPGYVSKPSLTPDEAIAMIIAAAGVPVLAHPLTPGTLDALPAFLPRLIAAGLRGMEVYYARYDDGTRAALLALANQFDLIPTGGSDYHGEGIKPGPTLGEVTVPSESVARLRAAAGR